MAKIIFSAVVGDARAKAGGVVFTKGRFGAVVRRKVSPVQPRTSYQTNVRALFTLLTKRWGGTLTATQRAGWISLAQAFPQKDVFGNNITLTGLQMYIKLNRNLQTIAVAVIDDPPVTLSVGSPGTFTLSSAVGPPITLTGDAGTEPATGEVPVVEAVAPVSPGRSFVGNRYRYIFKAAAATAGPWDIAATYAAKFGTLVANQNVSARVYYVNNTTGAASQKASSQVIIA
jgi:hypothetical protein